MPGTERTDWIPEPDNTPDDWEIGGPPLEVQDGDDDLLVQRIVEWAAVLRRVGGVVSCAAVRREIAPEHFETVGFAFKWDSFAPTERLPRAERPRKPRHEQEPAPEPAEAVAEAVEDDDEDLYDGEGERQRDPGDVLAGSA